MWSNDATLKHRSGSPLLNATAPGLGALVAAAQFLGMFDGGLPKSARAEVAAPAVLAGGGGPLRPSIPGLCFHGPGGELLDLSQAGQHCR